MWNGRRFNVGLVGMGKFSSPNSQATSVINELQSGGLIKSLGTARNYKQSLTRVAEFAKENGFSLRQLTKADAEIYLTIRGEVVGQKTLDMERQSMQVMMHLTGKLKNGESMSAKSEKQQSLSGRAYTNIQVQMIADRQNENNKLATEIAYAAGLRAHELLTLRLATERPADNRPALDRKFDGREGEIYTVQGKGGLVREVLIPKFLVKRLEGRILPSPIKTLDRTIYYSQYYSVSGGNKFSSSFNIASNKALGWSTGAHGLRHSYAQERMVKLQSLGLSRAQSLEIVSQEMGHFRPEITETYLR